MIKNKISGKFWLDFLCVLNTYCRIVTLRGHHFWFLSGGKRDEKLILPINSSISATLHVDQMCTTTTVAASRDFCKDRIWLNGRLGLISSFVVEQ